MTTFIQAHLLTVYGPQNMNRDDTGRPKTANFGSCLRLRISSQSWKRALRTSASFQQHFGETLGTRSRLIGEHIVKTMIGEGMAKADAISATRELMAQFGRLEADASAVGIRQLYFISPDELRELKKVAVRLAEGQEVTDKERRVITTVMSAPDIAMFGRMVADAPAFNIDAAVQVSHGITTHRAAVDEDAYTAVDDLNTGEEDRGAGFMGVFEFGAGVFYTYVCVNRDLLVKNLQGNEELADRCIAVLLEAATSEAPRGKQNSFAHQSRAGYVLVERGSQQPRNLAYAFLKPVGGGPDADYMALSIERLRKFRDKTDKIYGPSADDSYEIDMLSDNEAEQAKMDATGSIDGLKAWLAQGAAPAEAA
jgi:CRISPR system Cascade subunit CasC